MMTCCKRFAPYHQDVGAFFEDRPVLDQDAQSRSRDGERRVTVTARGLVLTRDLRVQHGREEVYDAARGGYRTPHWDHDTCVGGLGIDAGMVAAWDGSSRARVLDVASGLAIFGTELSALGAVVDCVDLEIDDAHPAFDLAASEVRTQYREQLELLQCLALHSDNIKYAMGSAELALLERLIDNADQVADTYPRVSGRRVRDNACELSKLDDATYDMVTCGWLMVHLEPADERSAIESMLRVTKPGGRIHIRAGYGGELIDRIREWKPDPNVVIARDDLVVLQA